MVDGSITGVDKIPCMKRSLKMIQTLIKILKLGKLNELAHEDLILSIKANSSVR